MGDRVVDAIRKSCGSPIVMPDCPAQAARIAELERENGRLRATIEEYRGLLKISSTEEESRLRTENDRLSGEVGRLKDAADAHERRADAAESDRDEYRRIARDYLRKFEQLCEGRAAT